MEFPILLLKLGVSEIVKTENLCQINKHKRPEPVVLGMKRECCHWTLVMDNFSISLPQHLRGSLTVPHLNVQSGTGLTTELEVFLYNHSF